MIETVALSKSFGRNKILNNVEVTFADGEVTYVLGLNGAGKSTLLRLCAGLELPSSGSVKITGNNLKPLQQLGIHLENHGYHPNHSAHKHLHWLATAGGIPFSRVAEVLKKTELVSVKDLAIAAYSLGMRQRLGIATALLGDPASIILDEPINGLDISGIRWTRKLFRELAAEGRCVVVASHFLSEAQRTAHKVVVLHRGNVLAAEGIETFIAHDGDLESAYARVVGVADNGMNKKLVAEKVVVGRHRGSD